jgi:hypothetical protein
LTYTVTAADGTTTETVTVEVKLDTVPPAPAPTPKVYFSNRAADCKIFWTEKSDGTIEARLLLPFADGADPAALGTKIATITGVTSTKTPIVVGRYLEIGFTVPSFTALGQGVLRQINYTLTGDPTSYVQTFAPMLFSATPTWEEVAAPDAEGIVSVEKDGSEVVVTYEDGTEDTYDLDNQELVIEYPDGRFTPSGQPPFSELLISTADGKLILPGTYRVFATRLGAGTAAVTLTADVTYAGGKTVVTVDIGSLPDGTYDLVLQSPESDNPRFKVLLADNVQIESEESDDGKGGGGGCDAGFGSAALMFAFALAGALGLRKK